MPQTAAATMQNQASIYKTIWPQEVIEQMMFKRSILLALCEKDTEWDGDLRKIVVKYAGTNGRSHSYDAAYANRRASKKKHMSIETADNFSLFAVDHKAVTLARNKKGAVVKLVEDETKNAIEKLARDTAMKLHGNGGGALGQIDSTTNVATPVLKFRSTKSLRGLDEGDVLEFSTDDGTGGAGTLAVKLEVVGVNYKTREATLNANLNTVPGLTTSSYVFIDGDYGAAIKGLPYYIARTDTIATNVQPWGMNGAPNLTRLRGYRCGGKGLPADLQIKKLLTQMRDLGEEPTHILCGTQKHDELDTILGTNRRYADVKVGEVGFTGIKFVSTGGETPVLPDPDLDEELIYAITADKLVFASAGEYPDWLTMDGKRMESEEASNSFMGKIGGYSQFYPLAPGQHGVLDTTVT